MRDCARKLLSQNFIWNRELVSKLIRESSISSGDLVVEIGAGKGIITEGLLDRCGRLVAVESDQSLIAFLKNKFRSIPRLSLVSGDFLDQPLPREPFKVFSNIPFSITGEIVKKLLFSAYPPEDTFLVVQTEAAEKFVMKTSRKSMLAILLYPWFEVGVVHSFQRSDFRPKPGVESCLIRVRKRDIPLIALSHQGAYRDFVVYFFNRDRKAVSWSADGWRSRFEVFENSNDRRHSEVDGSFGKWQDEEKKLVKIHRSRTDRGWKGA